ncbi:hypothetical protein [Streptomyces pactum]|uniref:hypothetical protein n=1 Tax=Streptomyces pactum TaxID=68249 RepID=UPI003701361B
MPRFLLAAVTAVVAAALAVGAAIGIVAILNDTPEQPNVPLVTFPTGTARPDAGREAGPGADREAGAEDAPDATGRTPAGTPGSGTPTGSGADTGTDRGTDADRGAGTDSGADTEAGREPAGAAPAER